MSRLRRDEGSRSLEIASEVLEGSTKELIVDEAKRWGADLIVVGSQGRGTVLSRFRLARRAAQAPCSVEIVR